MTHIPKKAKALIEERVKSLVNGQVPAPNTITKGFVQVLRETVSAEKVSDVINQLLDAEKVVSLGQGMSERQPDWLAREAGAKLYAAYVEGTPIQRQQIVNVQQESMDTIQEKLEISPAFRKALRDLLDQSEKKVEPASPPTNPNEG